MNHQAKETIVTISTRSLITAGDDAVALFVAKTALLLEGKEGEEEEAKCMHTMASRQ